MIEGFTCETGSFAQFWVYRLNDSVPKLITQPHIFEQRLSSTDFFSAAEITLDWDMFSISGQHRHRIRLYRLLGAYKTPYFFDILLCLGR